MFPILKFSLDICTGTGIDLIKVNDLGHDLIRVGSTNDGGYLIPNILNEIDYCFSPGIGNKFEFEKDKT